MSELDELEQKFYALFEQKSEWHFLKGLLDKINSYIIMQKSFSLKQILVLSKITFLSLSPNVSQVHPQVYYAIDTLANKTRNPKILSFLAFSLFSHCKRVDKATMGQFLQVMISYLGIAAENQTLVLGFLTALLSNLDCSKEFVEISKSIIERNPVVAEELVWIEAIQAKSAIKPVFKLLESIKNFRSDLGIILRGFVSGLNNKDLHCRYAAVDSVVEYFSLKNSKFHNAKVFIFSCLLERIHDKRMLLRLSKFVHYNFQEYLEEIVIQSVNYLLTKNQFFDVGIIGVLQDHDSDIRFVSHVFYEQVISNFLVNLGKFEELAGDEYFANFAEVFGKNEFVDLTKAIFAGFGQIVDRSDSWLYFKGLSLVKRKLKINHESSEELLNMLIDSIQYFVSIPEYYLCCSCFLSSTFPTNISNFLSVCNQNLESLSKSALQSFSHFYLTILDLNKKIKIKSFSLANRKLNSNLIEFLRIIVNEMKIPLTCETLQLLWEQYSGEFHEDIKFILLHSSKSGRDWVKIVMKQLRTKKGVLLVYSFFSYCFLERLTVLGREEIVKNLYLELYEVIEEDYSLQPYLMQLWLLITSDVSIFFEPVFRARIGFQSAFGEARSRRKVLKIFEVLNFAVIGRNVDLLGVNLIEEVLGDQINFSGWFKTRCNVYSDMLFAVCFWYLVNYKGKDVCISAFNVLNTFAKFLNYQQALKLIEFSYECLSSMDLRISVKVLIIKIFNSLDFSLIINQQKNLTMNLLKNSALISLSSIVKNEFEKEKKVSKKHFEQLLDTLVQFYYNISEFYINENLFNLVPAEFLKLIFFNMTVYPDNENSYILFEFLMKFNQKLPKDWLASLFLSESPNIFDLLYTSEQSSSSFLLNNLSHVLRIIVPNNPYLSSGVVQLWSTYIISKSDSPKLESFLKYIPLFEISFEKLLISLSDLINSTSNSTSHKSFLEFLHIYTQTFQSELELTKKSVISIGNITKHVKLHHCFLPLTDSFSLILRSQDSDEILNGTVKILSEYYKKFFNEFFEKGLTGEIHSPEDHLIKYKAVCAWLQEFGYNFCSILWPNSLERNKLIVAWSRSLLKKLPDLKFASESCLQVFVYWCKNSALYNQHLRPVFMEIVSNNENLLKLFYKQPSACFKWCEILNQCSSHTKLFQDFRTMFIPKGKNSTYLQETARLCFVSAMLIYAGDTDDYLHPEIHTQIKKELNQIIYIDNFFPIAVLMLIVLSIRVSFDQFLEIFQNFWPIVLTKFYENQNRGDLIVLCSILKLLDVLVALDFHGISQIYFFNRPVIISEGGCRRQLVVQIPEALTMKILREQQEKLIVHYNTLHTNEGDLDSSSISNLIENEFYRFKDLA